MRHPRTSHHATLLAVLLLLSGCFHTPPKPPQPPLPVTVIVSVLVTSESAPVAGASLRLDATTGALTGTTNASGQANFTVPIGLTKSHLWVEAEGYEPYNQHLDIDGQNLSVPVVLTKVAPPPPVLLCQATPFETVQAVRARYGAVPTREELGALLNEVAWCHREAGWGLSAKPGGYNVPQPGTGQLIASDILHHQPTGVIYDVLIGAGEQSTPTWHELGPQTDPSRPWVAPVAPLP